MAYQLGKDIIVQVGGVAVAGQQEAVLVIEGDAIETTTKSDFPARAFTGGFYSWHIHCTSLIELTDAGLAAVEAAALSRQPVTVQTMVGTKPCSGQALVTLFSYAGPLNKAAVATCILRGIGALAMT